MRYPSEPSSPILTIQRYLLTLGVPTWVIAYQCLLEEAERSEAVSCFDMGHWEHALVFRFLALTRSRFVSLTLAEQSLDYMHRVTPRIMHRLPKSASVTMRDQRLARTALSREQFSMLVTQVASLICVVNSGSPTYLPSTTSLPHQLLVHPLRSLARGQQRRSAGLTTRRRSFHHLQCHR